MTESYAAPTAAYPAPGAHAGWRVEDPRRHPLGSAGLALAVLALVLSVVALTRTSDGVTRVRVGNSDCVSVPQTNAPDALYCRTTAVPK